MDLNGRTLLVTVKVGVSGEKVFLDETFAELI